MKHSIESLIAFLFMFLAQPLPFAHGAGGFFSKGGNIRISGGVDAEMVPVNIQKFDGDVFDSGWLSPTVEISSSEPILKFTFKDSACFVGLT